MMPRHATHRADAELLQILEWRFCEDRTPSWIAERLGVTRNAVIGAIHRCEHEAATQIGPALDGTLPRGWWQAGLKLQAAS